MFESDCSKYEVLVFYFGDLMKSLDAFVELKEDFDLLFDFFSVFCPLNASPASRMTLLCFSFY